MKKLLSQVKDLVKQKRWGQLALTLLPKLLLLGVAIKFLVWLLEGIGNFIALKFDVIITVVAVSIVAIYMWNSKRAERRVKMKEIQEQQAKQAAEVELAVAENNYSILRSCLFSVLAEKAVLVGIVKPTTLSEMNSPSRIIPRNGFILCQFVAMKQGGEVDLKLVKECLQMRIVQKLNAGEFAELNSRTHIYNGRAYPILYIDEILDTGAYIQLNLALANDAYCQYLESKMYSQQQNTIQPTIFPRDTDY